MATKKISPLDAASQRLSAAFSKLEAVTATCSTSALPTVNEQGWMERMEELEAEIASLREENALLRDEASQAANDYHDLQQSYIELQQIMESTASRLERKAEQLELMA